jgi:hypothetical protein
VEQKNEFNARAILLFYSKHKGFRYKWWMHFRYMSPYGTSLLETDVPPIAADSGALTADSRELKTLNLASVT